MRVGPAWYAFALIGMPLLYFASIAVVPERLVVQGADLTTVLLYRVSTSCCGDRGPLAEEPVWLFCCPVCNRVGTAGGTVVLGCGRLTADYFPRIGRL